MGVLYVLRFGLPIRQSSEKFEYNDKDANLTVKKMWHSKTIPSTVSRPW
jgi:hypothetical protein